VNLVQKEENPFFVERSSFLFCGMIHNFFGRIHFYLESVAGISKSQTPFFWSSKSCRSTMREKLTPFVKMVIIGCFSQYEDPKSLGGILFSGNCQENQDFLLTLFDPKARAILQYIEPPTTICDRLLQDDDLSSIITIPKCVF
jgi:hypothetical protein